jgi:acyl-coenzyme A synthetase/AMP-(fatty) acid ligase
MGAAVTSLWDLVAGHGAPVKGEFHGASHSVAIADLASGSTLGGQLESLRGRSVLIATHSQLPTALALIELDGVARRMVLCTPELSPELLAHVASLAEGDAIIVDAAPPPKLPATAYPVTPRPEPAATPRRASHVTEWVLLTSGTTGVPKLVVHTLQSLAGALPRQPPAGRRCVWSTFYDIRRYGGLQMYLRALACGLSFVLSTPGASTREYFTRAAAHGVTHISGTPSHWRGALMSGDAALLTPDYVRLSGEVADQALLDGLRSAYPGALVAHAFASTEAGVAFEVNDGLAGFPAALLGEHGEILRKVENGTLRVRSPRIAAGYLGDASRVADAEGFVDTGDLIELQGDRYYFRGRDGGIINVGGLKVYPEEVEAVLNADPRVRVSLVRARRNSITGAVVVADVVAADSGSPALDAAALDLLRTELLNACRRTLPPHKVPAMLRFVAELGMTPAGKLVRPRA